jgi:hypothetical protein
MAERHSTEKQPSEFFSIKGRYLIDPRSSTEGLLEDAGCLLGVALDAIEAEATTGALSRAGWSSLYNLRQAQAVLGELTTRLHNEASEAIKAADARRASS